MFNKTASLIFILLFIAATYSGIALAGSTTEITVSAAVSLRNAFEEIGRLYESRERASKVVFNFGASGNLMAQIKGGAPVDVFASAALQDMDELDKEGFIVRDTRTNFAANAIVLIVPSSSTIELSSFEDLNKAEVSKIAVGNPQSVPVGRYSDEVLKYYKISARIQNRLVFAENVKQVLDYVIRDEVDAGVVYSTDAKGKQKEVRIVMTAPEASHEPIIYPIAVVTGTKYEKAAKAFVSLVASEEGKKILSKYGFKPMGQAR